MTTAPAVPRRGDNTADVHPLSEQEQEVLRAFVRLGAAHSIAALAGVSHDSVRRAAAGGAMCARTADALRTFLRRK